MEQRGDLVWAIHRKPSCSRVQLTMSSSDSGWLVTRVLCMQVMDKAIDVHDRVMRGLLSQYFGFEVELTPFNSCAWLPRQLSAHEEPTLTCIRSLLPCTGDH